jgi:hypothetical protein
MNAIEDHTQAQAPEPVGTEAPRQAAASPPPPQPQPAARAWPDPVHASRDPRRKSPLLASVLSIMPGLGQVYVGYYKMGFIHMAVWGGVLALTIAAGKDIEVLIAPGVVFLVFFYLYNIIDASRRASFYNQALAGVQGLDVPPDMALPTPGGSIAGGVVLIVIGVILLSNTRFGISMAWLEDWWPVAPIALGAWLVYRGAQEKKPSA